jgi:ATP-binding cassette subfamily F protein uup
MALLGLSGIVVAHGGPPILDEASLTIDEGERVGLLGRNASGKSTLLGVIAGSVVPDGGEVTRRQGLVTAYLPQEVPRGLRGTVDEVVRAGVRPGEEAWRTKERLERLLQGLALDPAADVARLSAGLARRALLARALAGDPDMLLLDEPTNHLDVPTIEWLERHLLERNGSLLFVTHDRAFLRRLATRILEVDRGRLTSWPGDYEEYLRRQEERAASEERGREQADRLLAHEETWIRKGLKAQRKRSEARVLELERMRKERRERRDPTGQVRLGIAEAERSGRLVLEAKGLTAGYPGKVVVEGLDLAVLRGDRIGLLGENGTGKTTLLRTLLGDLPSLAGTIRRGTNLETVWFDPLHAGLDPEKTVVESVGDGSTFIVIGDRKKLVMGYLADFLFPADRVRQPVKNLSGGERNRLLLARLFARPSNLLALDEPTNDLDAETLDLLEDALLAYPGTVLVISHDRDFLDQVATSLLVFQGGAVKESVGGYADWVRQGGALSSRGTVGKASGEAATPQTRRSNKERREIERLEAKIASLEEEQKTLHRTMEAPEFWTGAKDGIESTRARLTAVETELMGVYERWTALGG